VPKNKLPKITKLIAVIAVLSSLTACGSFDQHSKNAKPAPLPVVKEIKRSAKPLKVVSVRDVRYAQTALTQLGYNLGAVDGMWGPRSAKAIIAFEKTQKIASAGGKLSELNLYALSKTTKVLRSAIEGKKKTVSKKNKGLDDKLDKATPLSSAPQLIILDHPYPVLSKANPYSEIVTTLRAGAGVYVIARQGEWYEIESLERERGFIKEKF